MKVGELQTVPNHITQLQKKKKERKSASSFHIIDQQNRALEAATITLRYFAALCLPMGKTLEIYDLHFLAKPGFFQANFCDVTKEEVPNCVLTCYMRNEFIAVRVYQAVKNPATTDEFGADLSFMRELTLRTHPGVVPSKLMIIIRFARNISRQFVCLHNHHCHLVYYAN